MAEPTYTEIFDGPRKIEHTSPAPLTEEEINQILAEPPSADQQRAYDQQALRDYILSMDGPQLSDMPGRGAPAHVAPPPPGDPHPPEPIGYEGGGPEFNPAMATAAIGNAAGDAGGTYYGFPEMSDAEAQQMFDKARGVLPTGGARDFRAPLVQEPRIDMSKHGLNIQKDEPTVDQALEILHTKNNWWQAPVTDDLPPEFADLTP